jgi:hypothetical protein
MVKKTPHIRDSIEGEKFTTLEIVMPLVPPRYQVTPSAALQRAKRGTFPKPHRPGSQKSEPLFSSVEVAAWAEIHFGKFWPSHVANIRRVLGVI